MTSRYLDAGDAVPLRPAVAKALASRYSNHFAMQHGRDDALFLQQLEYQLHRRGGKEHDGQHWVFKKRSEWADELAMGDKEFRNCRDRLVASGFVIAIDNPGNGFYKTLWYRIDYERLDAYLDEHLPERLRSVGSNRVAHVGHSSGPPGPTERPSRANRVARDGRLITEKTNTEDEQETTTYIRAREDLEVSDPTITADGMKVSPVKERMEQLRVRG